MSLIVEGILDLTFGLLWDKLRDHTAERLRDGDVTDEKCRQFVVRELENMKSLLEGLSRRELLASISFLQEGICLLKIAFGHALDDGEMQCKAQENGGSEADRHRSNEMADMVTGSKKSGTITNQDYNDHERFGESIKQLSRIIASLGIVCNDRLSSARRSFQDARREATRAFSNEALSTTDRILACKLRVISRMLESFEDPVTVAGTCMQYLAELHNLQAIQSIFNVHTNGGLKSRFNRQKRRGLMSSVIMINYVLANFILSFAMEKFNLLHWPKIEISRGLFHPLLDTAARAVMHTAKIAAPNIFQFDGMTLKPDINKKFNCQNMPEILSTGSGHIAQIIIQDGIMKLSFFSSLDEIATEAPRILLFVTDDDEDSIYVVAFVEVFTGEFEFSLLIAKRIGTVITHETNLKFLAEAEKNYRESAFDGEIEEFFSDSPTHTEFVVNTASKTLIFGHQTCIFICDKNGVLSNDFETNDRNDILCLTHNSELITAAYSSNKVYLYSLSGHMLGHMLHTFDVNGGQIICDVAVHRATHMIYALTRNFQKGQLQLEIFTQHGEACGNFDLFGTNFFALFPLREGPVAVLYNKGFVLI